MIKIQLDSDDWTKIQNAMFVELQKCGSNPSNRFLRMAFYAACKEIGIELVYNETDPKKEQK
jgi:hypothetical protein